MFVINILSSTVAVGILGTVWIKRSGGTSEADKIQEIFANSGLSKRGGSIHLQRKSRKDWGTEYAYRIPLGLSFEDFQSKQNAFRDGLNNRRTLNISWEDFKEIDWRGNIVEQVRWLFTKNGKQKEIEMDYDGLLKIRVYNGPMPSVLPYDSEQATGWEVPVGQLRTKNEMLNHNFESIPHMSIGGATRYGKSQFLHMMINTLIRNKPDQVSFTFVDLKGGVEFYDYKDLKQTVNLALEPEEVCEALKAVYDEMRAKQIEQRKNGHKNVQQAKDGKRHFIIMDEVGELNPDEAVTKEEKKLKEQCQTYMSQIARLGAGLGYRLILATQYGTGDIIPRQCKQNSDARICFRVRNATASRVVLDREGAEELPLIKGRAIYQMADRHLIVQTPLIDEEEIKQTIKPHTTIKARDEDASAPNRKTDGKNSIDIEEI